jgi:Tol biopolymer transport system component
VLNYEVFPNKKRLVQIEKNAQKPYTVLYEFDESGNLDSLLSSNTGNFTFNSLKDELVYQKFTEEEGMEIWAYNLEKEEERLVLDFTPGRGSSNITFAKAYGDKLYYLAELSKEEGQQLWLYQMEEKEIEQILAVNEASQELKIYPNPTSKNLKIASDEIFQSYTIFNIAGRKMLEGKLKETNSVEVSNLPAGYYLLNLKNNESHVTKRFVIQN